MEDVDPRVLEAAWQELRAYLDEADGPHDIAQRKATVAIALGYSGKQFENWLEKGGTVPDSRRARVSIIRAYRNITKISDPYWYLAGGISSLLRKETEDFHVLRRYEGTYKVFRLGLSERFIVGEIEFSNRNKEMPFMHFHSSVQSIGAENIEFDHKGPVFEVSGRMYCLAVGISEGDSYFRPMILKMVDEPRIVPTFGILLTEHHDDFIPMAAKIALVHTNDPSLTDEMFLSDLEDGLKSTSSNPHILFGTKRMPKKHRPTRGSGG